MTKFETASLTRRAALRGGLAAIAASGGLLVATRGALADDTLAEIKKRGELVAATEFGGSAPEFATSTCATRPLADRASMALPAPAALARFHTPLDISVSIPRGFEPPRGLERRFPAIDLGLPMCPLAARDRHECASTHSLSPSS